MRGCRLMGMLGVLAFVIPTVCVAADIDATLATIGQRMADVKSVQADFVQEKKMAVFSSPLVMHGSMAWERPDSFAWHVDDPVRYAIVMRQGTARQWNGEDNTVQAFRMNGNPVMRVASRQIERWFGGHYDELSQEYTVTIASEKPLILACVPHEGNPEAGMVARILIRFRDDMRYIDGITIEEASGDTTSIMFEHARLNETVPETLWRVNLHRPGVGGGHSVDL